ncbi:hypothetical protein GF324_08715 [bacterium]|nr:hypothetical protein [bacterium]
MKLHPRTSASVLLALLLMLTSALPAGAARWKTLKPVKGGDYEKIVVNDKNDWSYQRLKPGKSMVFDISEIGGGKFRVITRADFGTAKADPAPYTFYMGIDDPDGRLYSRASEPDKDSFNKKSRKHKVGKSRIIEFDTESDAETVYFRVPESAELPVYFRFQRERDEFTGEVDYAAVTPRSYVDAIGISTREIISTYYRIDEDRHLTVELIGPTTLKILGRVIMDMSMRGRIKFRVAVYEDGQLKNTYPLSSRVSTVSTIIDMPDHRPSRGESFFVEVPKGMHRYTFALPDNGFDVMLRFFIPDKHLTRSLDED